MAPEENEKDYKASNAEEYTSFGLWIYDFLILKLVSSFVWRCPTSKYTLPLFRANATSHHLDIGVATGYFPSKHDFPRGSELTLCDLNPLCLETAEARLRRPDMKCTKVEHDILKPLPEFVGKFDSVSMLYLLHCLPSPTHRKTAVFSHIKRNLTPNGVVFGATILGERRCHTKFAYWWLVNGNEGPFFDNMGDTEKEFTDSLHKNFHEVETSVVGSIFLFKATIPKL